MGRSRHDMAAARVDDPHAKADEHHKPENLPLGHIAVSLLVPALDPEDEVHRGTRHIV